MSPGRALFPPCFLPVKGILRPFLALKGLKEVGVFWHPIKSYWHPILSETPSGSQILFLPLEMPPLTARIGWFAFPRLRAVQGRGWREVNLETEDRDQDPGSHLHQRSLFSPLRLSFLICKMEIIIVSPVKE